MLISKAILHSPNNGRTILALRQNLLSRSTCAVAPAAAGSAQNNNIAGCSRPSHYSTINSPNHPTQRQQRNQHDNNNNNNKNTATHKAAPFSTSPSFDALVQSKFPGAISNTALVTKVTAALSSRNFAPPTKTLLATSLCADELSRTLEAAFLPAYGPNFHLGGLSGFPFAGNTGFGAMAAHIPDDGACLLIHGPHVGITKDGIVGKVERPGVANVDTCCGSAVAASNYLKGIHDGTATVTSSLRSFTDFQQGAVQELLLPFGNRLEKLDGEEKRMTQLPYALYDAQEVMMNDIIEAGKGGIKKGGLAILGGIQINTGPETEDYFKVLRLDCYDENGEVVASLLEDIIQ
mmetsp:Transcript_40509/g.69102  ORF Transcript_40509/g.69102 Transcript_40509/m.69102 type:complete len:349 (+) Transcript_40509:96-1142(+)|eukprot:CAMPEP_0183728950 /NCGR_PEP_ID=MMETSP0737-20130205/29337_1 /TAXON_ID=385413 /ORGANISM="Thalassiosira miniscula, Strain CCMP1093" /LENGTH=348 /DNA_ID=CAMNT_0025961029 /DNA_START=62 /DNA_END=1111 /DNA_ORIENTATION=-